MPHYEDDFLDLVQEQYVEQRDITARSLDRQEALADLHVYAIELSDRLRRPLHVEDVFYDHAKDEETKARLRALVDRIDIDTEFPALGRKRAEGHPLDSGEDL